MTDTFFAALGYVGAMLILLAYFQVSHGAWTSGSRVFQVTNAVGALSLTAYALRIEAWPNVLLNGVWLAVAVVALYRLKRRR